MIYRLIVIFILAIVGCSSLIAQDFDNQSELTRLTRENEKLRKDSVKLARENEKLQKRLDKDRIADLESRCDSLIEVASKADERVKAAYYLVDSVNNELNQLLAFKVKMVEETAASISSYLDNGYNDLSIDSLSKLLKNIEPFVAQSDELRAVGKRANATKERLSDFMAFNTEYLTMPYSETMNKKFATLKDKIYSTSNTLQQSDISGIESGLRNYPAAIDAFGKLTEMVGYQMEYYRENGGEPSQVKEFVEAIFQDYEPNQKAEEQSLISPIPYLKGLYDRYLELLQGDQPLSPEVIEIESIISSMKKD